MPNGGELWSRPVSAMRRMVRSSISMPMPAALALASETMGGESTTWHRQWLLMPRMISPSATAGAGGAARPSGGHSTNASDTTNTHVRRVNIAFPPCVFAPYLPAARISRSSTIKTFPCVAPLAL
ncbi:MAG: hypothetical protein ABSG68_14555 [Thermoguttaceae bacterium]